MTDSYSKLIFVGLYLFVGLDALTNIKVNTADNAVCMLNWWSVELSTHAFQVAFCPLSCLAKNVCVIDIPCWPSFDFVCRWFV